MTTMDYEDPFEGLLERSSVAQALREARASLARPSRPFTPASRSLFQQSPSDETHSQPRPSSSYSIDQLSFVRDTFVSSACGSTGSARSGGSTRTPSSRSGLRSRDSLNASPSVAELCAVPELEEPELELPPPPAPSADVLAFGEQGDVIYTSHAGGGALEFDVEDPDFDEAEDEFDAGCAADDLALRMDVPPPGSDEESAAEEDLRKKRASIDGKPRATEKLRRKSSSSKLGGSSRSIGDKASRRSFAAAAAEFAIALRQATEELEALERGSSECFDVDKLMASAEKTRALLAQLRESRQPVDQEPSRLLRAVLSLMERTSEAVCLLRLARCTLELLQVESVLKDVGLHGVEAAYLNVARALFKLSKDAGNDGHFRDEGILEPLLLMLGDGADGKGVGSTELRVFVVGVLKNVSNNEDNQKRLVKHGALPGLLSLLRPAAGLTGSAQEAQLLVQVTALLRNLAASSKRQQQLVELSALETLAVVSSMYMANKELQVNIARVFAKLSQTDAACQVLEADPSPLQQITHCLREHAALPTLVLRLSFALGNLTANSDHLRRTLMFDCDMAGLLPVLLERYWQQDRKLAQANSSCLTPAGTGPNDAQDTESVLVKLVRLVANVTINGSVGTLVASEASVVDPLLGMLGCKRMPESEELVLSATAAATNLLFYDSPTNLLFTAENKHLLCRLLRPMLLESYNVEALVEAARALGNLSRHRDARQWIGELRIDEALSILLAHGDRDLVFYTCGALVNLAADPQTGGRLCRECGLRAKIANLLSDTPADDPELLLVGVKVLSNLRLEGDGRQPWPEDTLRDARAGIARAREASLAVVASKTATAVASARGQGPPLAEVLAANTGTPPPEEILADLAQRLLDSLPSESEVGTDLVHAVVADIAQPVTAAA
eukprot:CAMPEP_0115301700 /NCGR_PEP_ID=MMETSP0270-20121206/69996_1 /TAXON_ID=71861 /ORGANISM="Scrippsiella trochoidea, Strain CCMP3099" /LENGTH=902 /DNA_ID=CAMNT_0002719591 /DNA_START=1 /DNA_END=2709 /DNA_ORIENTATION=+